MEEKRRSKRSKILDEGYWDCSVCTYQNSPEAFKCDMCDVRKGTSTRKPRINAQLVAQQVAQQFAAPTKKDKNVFSRGRSSTSTSSSPTLNSSNRKTRPSRLKNVDRSSGVSMEVTVGSVTVVITDYQPRDERAQSPASPESTSVNLNSSNNESGEECVNGEDGELNGSAEQNDDDDDDGAAT